MKSFKEFREYFSAVAEKHPDVINTINLLPSNGIPAGGMINVMEHGHIERIARAESGEYVKNPDKVYVECLKNLGITMLDQYLAHNPLDMGDHGYENHEKSATTGLNTVEVDGMIIDSPEAVISHMEKFVIPSLQAQIKRYEKMGLDTSREAEYFDTFLNTESGREILKDVQFARIIDDEYHIQKDLLGEEILKCLHSGPIPGLRYGTYGYENYFMAYVLYPEVFDEDFRLQSELCRQWNTVFAHMYKKAGVPPAFRLDHDIADSRSTLIDIKSLDKIWFPRLAYAIEPFVKAGFRCVWHCDGNLMETVPRLLEVGIKGFQGFQYEHGMDYEKICRMKTRDNESLLIYAGVSVTKTLPFGTPEDVRDEINWLVENGPDTGLILGMSSSMAPGVPWKNVEMMIEGFKFYSRNGKKCRFGS